jgi:tetratricopeptide (TPR) repeat protein
MEEGFYKLESQVSNGGQSIFFNGDYMDNDKPVALTIMKVGSYYTIASGENYYGWDGKSTVLGKNLTADDRNALWSIITLDSAKTALKDATLAHPIDATMLIEDHDFGRNNRYASNWETWSETADAGTNFKISGGEDGNGSVGNNCAESYHAKFTLKQTLTGVPKGVYALTAQGFYRQDGSDNDHLPYFYANDEKQVFPLKTGAENSMTDAGKSFKNGLYTIDPIYVEVKEGGELVIGAKLEENTNLWCIWDNFVLTYYGPDATIEAVKSIAPLVENYMKAQDVLFGTIDVETARMALQDAVNMAMEEVLQLDEEGTLVLKEGATQEKIQATIDALKAGMEKVSAVAKVTPVLRAMENVANSTNIYTQEAYAAYKQIYDGLVDKYGKAEFTVAETANLENPETNLGWHTENSVDDFLLSAWSIGETKCRNYEAGMYVNVWSTEGDNDGSNFRTPFYEYWTGDGESLAANKLSATMDGLVPEGTYNVTAWVRVRLKNGAAAPATGITLQAGAGEAVDVAAGEQVGTSQFYLKEFSATGEADQTGKLTIQFNIAADNNISWLSFKNVKLEYSGGDIYHKIDKSTVLDVPYISSLNETERLWLKGGRNTRKMGLTINPELAEDAQKELQGTMFEGIQINPAVSGAQFQTLIKGADYVVAYVVSEVEASFTLTATENVEDAEVMPEVKTTTKEMAHHHSTEVVRLALDKNKEYRIDYTSNETDVVLHYVEFIVTNEKLEAAYDSLKNEIEAANKLHTEYLADATLENYLAALQLIIDRAPNGFAFSKDELVYKSVKLLQDAETDFRKVVQGYVDLRARVKEVTDFRNKEVKEFLDSIGDQTALMAEFETLLKDLDDAFEQADKALQGKDVDNVVRADINLTRCEVYLSLRMHINQAETSYNNYIFGEEALKEILGEAVAKAAEEMRNATLAAVEAYKGSDNQAAEDARQALIDAEEKFAEAYNKAVEDYNTGIATLKTNANGGAIYNMQGVKMQKADTKGIYIVNGKKLIVK